MKNLFLLLLIVSAGFTSQAQDLWTTIDETQKMVYSIATELHQETDNIVAQDNIISITTSKGTISLEKKIDKSKPEDKQHFIYNLLTTNGKVIKLDKMNAEKVVEGFYKKLLTVKDELRKNQDSQVNSILEGLF